MMRTTLLPRFSTCVGVLLVALTLGACLRVPHSMGPSAEALRFEQKARVLEERGEYKSAAQYLEWSYFARSRYDFARCSLLSSAAEMYERGGLWHEAADAHEDYADALLNYRGPEEWRAKVALEDAAAAKQGTMAAWELADPLSYQAYKEREASVAAGLAADRRARADERARVEAAIAADKLQRRRGLQEALAKAGEPDPDPQREKSRIAVYADDPPSSPGEEKYEYEYPSSPGGTPDADAASPDSVIADADRAAKARAAEEASRRKARAAEEERRRKAAEIRREEESRRIQEQQRKAQAERIEQQRKRDERVRREVERLRSQLDLTPDDDGCWSGRNERGRCVVEEKIKWKEDSHLYVKYKNTCGRRVQLRHCNQRKKGGWHCGYTGLKGDSTTVWDTVQASGRRFFRVVGSIESTNDWVCQDRSKDFRDDPK